MTTENRFLGNPNGTITDNENHLFWLPKDSRQDLGKWVNWQEALAYAKIMNQVYAGGFCDWRFPTKAEALSFYDENLRHLDWENTLIHIHPLFARGAAYYMWVNDVDENGHALRLNLRDGSLEYIDKTTLEHQAVRLVRKAQ
ncbi:MAG: hypothetical protein A3K09_04770 [Nitrospinae bacterium RIFCSPLOWO2_12_FULL_47_7]|nr:MAG: hypothetical protein A3K09_04770 [Nitrospinae bacterium RIFCSPLOWO2_12_FULL_47_7]